MQLLAMVYAPYMAHCDAGGPCCIPAAVYAATLKLIEAHDDFANGCCNCPAEKRGNLLYLWEDDNLVDTKGPGFPNRVNEAVPPTQSVDTRHG